MEQQLGFELPPVLDEEQDASMAKLPGWPSDPASASQAHRDRFVGAAVGCAVYLAPMIFMVWMRRIAARVAAVIVCTILCAGGLAMFTAETPVGILKFTAEYTAVLVVFIGTSTLDS
jgi:hypothetical protein